MRTQHAIGLLAALMLMACNGTGFGARQAATQETLTSATATVEAIDQTTREVRLRDDADGTVFVVTAGPEVRNLEQVSAGDKVTVDFYQSTTASMADPADTGEPADRRRWPPAHRRARQPGALAVASESMVVTVISYDDSTGLATFRTPDGFTRRAVVPPNLRSFAADRGPGSRVLVTMTKAVAVSVTPAA